MMRRPWKNRVARWIVAACVFAPLTATLPGGCVLNTLLGFGTTDDNSDLDFDMIGDEIVDEIKDEF